jgi:dolichol-phosphate mannosyltransferase
MDYSIVIPFFNEEDSATSLLDEIARVLPKVAGSSEVVAVDDGSSDATPARLKDAKTRVPSLRIVRLESRSGQSAALWAGITSAKGSVVITMDGDGQNDPADIPAMLNALKGHDAVFGWRKDRNDPWIKRISSLIANTLRNLVLGFDVHDTGCGLKVMRKALLEGVYPFKGMHRFFPALARMKNARFTEVPVRHRPRAKGKTKYGTLGRAFSAFPDLLAVRWMKKKKIDFKIKEIL